MVRYDLNDLDLIREKITNTHDFISTSYHEAGHTIYALLHFIKVDSVRVFVDKKTERVGGLTWYRLPPRIDHNTDLNFAKSEICLKYAGLVAEKHHFKQISGSDKFPLFLKDGSSEDTITAAKLIKRHNLAPPGKPRYNYKKKLIGKTLKELQKHWEAVTVVAHRLFNKKRISFDELRKMLTTQIADKEFWKTQFNLIDQVFF
jgi:hypothetical protein